MGNVIYNRNIGNYTDLENGYFFEDFLTYCVKYSSTLRRYQTRNILEIP